MNARKNKKVLIALSSVMALGTLGAVLAFSRGEEGLSRASAGVSSSIVFSREGGEFTKIDDKTASISGTSFTGAKYYAVSHNIGDISESNYVAQFGSGVGQDEQYVSFSTSPTGTNDFEFEAITGVKVWTTSGSSQTMYLRYSDDGSSFSKEETISGSKDPEKYSFKTSYKFVRLVGYSVMTRNVTKIELFYDCGVSPEPVSPDHIAAYNAKNYYEVGDSFVKPEVRMIFSDTSTEVISADKVSCSGYNMSVAGEQTVSVSAEYDSVVYNTSYKITVVDPASTSHSISYYGVDCNTFDYIYDLSEFLNVGSSSLPDSCNEDETLTIVTSALPGFEFVWMSIDEDDEFSFDTADYVTWTATMPSYDITVAIWFNKLV